MAELPEGGGDEGRAEMAADERTLLARLSAAEQTGETVRTVLRTDDRVLARISDGIYRKPGSALRELVANAYDADATTVVLRTDAPMFRELSVRDDGVGMNKETLTRLIHHIGGSAKRTLEGGALGVTDPSNPSLTIRGRRLIGKIGIGLFSVAQLTRHFRIITKRAGDKFRLVADVVLRTYSEDDLATRTQGDSDVVTGDVVIRTIPADDPNAHGTEVILRAIEPPARALLQSAEMWSQVLEPFEGESAVDPPAFHIGKAVDASERSSPAASTRNEFNSDVVPNDMFRIEPRLPWLHSDSPDAKFRKLVDAVRQLFGAKNPRPKISREFDFYLQQMWELSVSLPLDYLDRHPFDEESDTDIRVFRLANSRKGQPSSVRIEPSRTIRQELGLVAPARSHDDVFDVYFDDVLLRRPITFNHLPLADSEDLRKAPLLFVGSYSASLSRMPSHVSGGRSLKLEAYFLWTPKVVPDELKGVCVRIADASGTGFDPGFLGYQVQELNRLNQIIAEVYVLDGLDAALNIDRESFNFGHPHAKILSSWVHSALRQLATTQKRLASEARSSARGVSLDKQDEELNAIVASVTASPAEVVFVEDSDTAVTEHLAGRLALSRSTVFAGLPAGSGSRQQQSRALAEKQLAAIAQVLDSHDMFGSMDYAERENILCVIGRILGVAR